MSAAKASSGAADGDVDKGAIGVAADEAEGNNVDEPDNGNSD